jgi:hypothetical protein
VLPSKEELLGKKPCTQQERSLKARAKPEEKKDTHKQVVVKDHKNIGTFGTSTLSSSLKSRLILKNNFGAPREASKTFIPAGASAAKDQIARKIVHSHEREEMAK